MALIKETKAPEYSATDLPVGRLATPVGSIPGVGNGHYMVVIKVQGAGLYGMLPHQLVVNIESGTGSFGSATRFRLLPEGAEIAFKVDGGLLK
jgi:hypothetical protein